MNCKGGYINNIHDKDPGVALEYEGLPITQSLDDQKGWLVPLIFNDTQRRIEAEFLSRRKIKNCCSFLVGFIIRTIMPSHPPQP